MMGKNFDATGSFGPEFVTADELPAGATGLQLRTRLNGQELQNANTRDMIFDVATPGQRLLGGDGAFPRRTSSSAARPQAWDSRASRPCG